MAASQLLLSLYLVATLAVFATASRSDLKGLNVGSSSSSCDGTKKALLDARDKCCNDLGEGGHCVCSAATAQKVFGSVTFLHLCNNYDACSAGSWSWKPAAGGGGCSLDHLEQCNKALKVLKEHTDCFDDLALLKKISSGDSASFKEALVKLGLEDFHAVIEKLLPQGQGN